LHSIVDHSECRKYAALLHSTVLVRNTAVTNPPKKKNNHYVPQSYLKRFCSVSDRQVGLFNLKTELYVETAPIKSQCSKDYFYTNNPVFEDEFCKLEARQKELFDSIVDNELLPAKASEDDHHLLALLMFQSGRTASAAALSNNMLNQFGKALLKAQFEKDGNTEMLEFLPDVKLSAPNAILDLVGMHLSMYPLIGDLETTLAVNESDEDFLTSDHPVALCNSLPVTAPFSDAVGYSSRGLIIGYPISPRHLILLSDPEVYKVASDDRRIIRLRKSSEVIDLNLTQCFNAFQNFYFASYIKIQGTIKAFRKKKAALRLPAPVLTEEKGITPEGNEAVLLSMPGRGRRMAVPKAVELRRAARTSKFVKGDERVRDPLREKIVRAELDRLYKRREEATKKAKAGFAGKLEPEGQ